MLRVLRIAGTVLGLLLVASTSSWATPELQLFLDPAQNPGAFYDTGAKGWVSVRNNPVIVSVFMHDQDPADVYKLVISTPGFDPLAAGIGVPTISSGGETTGEPSGWLTGNPGLAPHGIFPASYVLLPFTFGAGDRSSIFNVASRFNPDGTPASLQGQVMGFRKDITLTFDRVDVEFHIDILNASQMRGQSGRFVSAPSSKHATVNPVPEPSAVICFLTGGLIVCHQLRRRLR